MSGIVQDRGSKVLLHVRTDYRLSCRTAGLGWGAGGAGQGASLDSQGCEIKDAPEAVPPVGSSLGQLFPPALTVLEGGPRGHEEECDEEGEVAQLVPLAHILH